MGRGRLVGLWPWLVQELEQGDCESGRAEAVRDEDAAEIFVETKFESGQIGLCGEGRGVEFLVRFRDAFGLCAGEAPLFEFLDDAVRVYHERLHTTSVYHPMLRPQAHGFGTGSARILDAVLFTDIGGRALVARRG
jgi:hypothetical protein